MEYADAKRFVLEYVRLGMSFDRACLASGCDETITKTLISDKAFCDILAREDAVLEANLKRDMLEIAESNKERGISTEVRWLLEHQFPNIYGGRGSQAPITELEIPDVRINIKE